MVPRIFIIILLLLIKFPKYITEIKIHTSKPILLIKYTFKIRIKQKLISYIIFTLIQISIEKLFSLPLYISYSFTDTSKPTNSYL